MPALPLYSDVDLLGRGKGVVDLDPEMTHSALDLRVAQHRFRRVTSMSGDDEDASAAMRQPESASVYDAVRPF